MIEIEDGGALGTVISGSLFDNTSLVNPPYGLIVHGDGFAISGNTFAGGDMHKTPSEVYVDIYGSGSFTGNTMLTSFTGIRVNPGGAYNIAGNYVVGHPALVVAGGAAYGGGNTWQAQEDAECAVDVDSRDRPTVLNLGPDLFPSASAHSYCVHPDGPETAGVLQYDPSFDQSRSGPTTTSPLVHLANLRFQPQRVPLSSANRGAGREAILAAAKIPARALDFDGRAFYFRAWGTTAKTPGQKRLRLLLNDSVLFDGSSHAGGAPWELHGIVQRTGATNEVCFVEGTVAGLAVPLRTLRASADLMREATLSVAATGAGGEDVTLLGLTVDPIQ
jgi:hypothetical protein